MRTTPSWGNTLSNTEWKFCHILDITDMATRLGYEYVCWEGKVYHVIPGNPRPFETEYVEADLGVRE